VELRGIILGRIKDLVDLEIQAAALLGRAAIAFTPFLAHCENEDVAATHSRKGQASLEGTGDQAGEGAGAEPAPKRAKKGAKVGSKKQAGAAAAAAADEAGSHAGTPQNDGEKDEEAAADDKGEVIAGKDATIAAGLDFARFKLYLRELEMDVFQVRAGGGVETICLAGLVSLLDVVVRTLRP
jgi:hypothetical protein